MKRFIKMLVLFCLVLFGLAVITDCFISYRLRHSQSREFKAWGDLYYFQHNNDILINGSSRGWTQYNPMIIDSVLGSNSWNLGIDASAINRQIVKYNTYCRESGTTPKLLIQNLEFSSMNLTKDIEREQFFPYFFYDRKLMKDIDRYESFSLLEKILPCYRYFGYTDVIISSIIRSKPFGLEKGYYGYDLKWDGRLFEKIDQIDISQDSNAIKMFDSFLNEITQSGTKVVFVYAPLYIEATKKISNLNVMYDVYGCLASKYNIPVLDYTFDELSKDTCFFYNATHLNKTGSILFSSKLAKDIDSLGIYR